MLQPSFTPFRRSKKQSVLNLFVNVSSVDSCQFKSYNEIDMNLFDDKLPNNSIILI